MHMFVCKYSVYPAMTSIWLFIFGVQLPVNGFVDVFKMHEWDRAFFPYVFSIASSKFMITFTNVDNH